MKTTKMWGSVYETPSCEEHKLMVQSVLCLSGETFDLEEGENLFDVQ